MPTTSTQRHRCTHTQLDCNDFPAPRAESMTPADQDLMPAHWAFGALTHLQMQRRTAQEIALRSDAALPVGEATEFHTEKADTGFALWTEALNAQGAAS